MGLEDKINEVANGPSKASGDAGSVEQQNLKDLIEADKQPICMAFYQVKR